MYRVLIERAAERDLSRLGADMHRRIVDAICSLGANPRPPGCRKLYGGDGHWRIRVSDYRVIYSIADSIRVVGIRRVRHGREVYRD